MASPMSAVMEVRTIYGSLQERFVKACHTDRVRLKRSRDGLVCGKLVCVKEDVPM